MDFYADITFFSPQYGEYKIFNGIGTGIVGFYIDDDSEITLSQKMYLPNGDFKLRIRFTTGRVPNNLFRGLNVRKVSFSDDMNEVGNYAFADCQYLEELYLESIKKIGQNAFSNNTKLKEVQLLAPLTLVGRCAFSHNTGLRRLYIKHGDEQKQILSKAFSKCYALEKIIFVGYEGKTNPHHKVVMQDLAFNDDIKLTNDLEKYKPYIVERTKDNKYLVNKKRIVIERIFYCWLKWPRKILK